MITFNKRIVIHNGGICSPVIKIILLIRNNGSWQPQQRQLPLFLINKIILITGEQIPPLWITMRLLNVIIKKNSVSFTVTGPNNNF